MLELRNRKGITLVMVAILMFVLVGATAIAIDFARLYLFKAEIQTTADAAAMAGTVDLVRGQWATAEATALAYKPRNLVNKTDTAIMAAADVEPGTWNPTTGFKREEPFSAKTSAIKVTAHYSGQFTLGKVFDASSAMQSAVAIGAVGSVSGSGCIKPWAVPYSNLLWTIGKPYATNADLLYELTAADITFLKATTQAKNIVFKISSNGDAAEVAATGSELPGNYYAVRFEPIEFVNGTRGNPTSGADQYEKHILTCSSTMISVGDWLQAENGNMVGKTKSGIEGICGGLNPDGSCVKPAKVEIPIYGESRTGGLPEFKVRYIGGFVVTRYKAGEVSGYFSSFSGSGGTWSSKPGPITKAAMVQ